MPIQFKIYSIPKTLTKDVVVPKEATEEISHRLGIINRKLIKKMALIARKERSNWQNSQIRN